MLHEIFQPYADRIFTHDPILRKLVKDLQEKEEKIDGENPTDKEILQRNKLG